MSKVTRHLMWRRLRDEIPRNSKNLHERSKRERYSFNVAMTKPTERDWTEHTLELLKKPYDDI